MKTRFQRPAVGNTPAVANIFQGSGGQVAAGSVPNRRTNTPQDLVAKNQRIGVKSKGRIKRGGKKSVVSNKGPHFNHSFNHSSTPPGKKYAKSSLGGSDAMP